MIRGTTPTHLFSDIPVLSTDIKQIWVSYLQNGTLVLTKDIDQVTITDDTETETSTVAVTLSQEETLLFSSGNAIVQLRILLLDDSALASEEMVLDVRRVIKNGKIE